MGIRFYCPNGHKLNVKSELAGKVGICPKCQARMTIPTESVREASGSASGKNSADATTEATNGDGRVDDSAFSATREETTEQNARRDSNEENAAGDDSSGKFFLNGERAEAALGDVLRRAVDGSAQSGRGAARFDDAEPLRDPRLVWYVRSRDNQQYGPATGDVMAAWINERRVGPQTLVWREDWPAWQEAGRVFPDLERVFVGGETTPSENGSAGVSAFASLAEAAQNSDAARRFADDESRAMRRRKRATKTFIAIAALIALILALLGALIFVLIRD